MVTDLTIIGPIVCPVKPRANKKLGGRKRGHWSGEGSLAAEQRARVRAAFSGRCSVCGASPVAVKITGTPWGAAISAPVCHPRARLVPHRLPPRGPEHPLDVLMLRVPSHGGRPLDDDGLQMALKAIRDQIAEELWPRDASGKLIGTVDDSVDWLRWLYGERRHRKPRKRQRPGDPPPDPSNVGTELLEIVIAERQVCQHCGDVPPIKQRWLGAAGRDRG